MNTKILTSLLTVLLVFILAGCSQGNIVTTKENKDTIQVALTSDSGADKLDAASYDGSMPLYTAVYDPLVEYGENGGIKPALAKSWEVTEDGKTYTFHLRNDVKFSDGSNLNADALLFSINRWKGKKEHAWLKTAATLERAEKIDDYTVKMTFSEPSVLIFNELTAARPLRVMSPNSVEPAGEPDGKFVKAIGSGALKIDSHKKGKETVLTPNKHYWKYNLKNKKIIWKVIPDAQTRSLALQEGSVQIAGGEMSKISYQALNVFKDNNAYKVETKPGTMSYFLAINNQKEALQDVKVRQALNYAINKEHLADKVLDKNGLPAKGLFARTVPFVTESNNSGYTYNLDKAKQLLKEAGYGKNGKVLKLKLAFQTEEFPEWKQISETIQSNLKEAGVEVLLNSMESTSYYNNLWEKRDYDLLIYRTYADSLNPQGFLDSLFVVKSDGKGVAYTDENLSNYIIEAGKAMTNDERQAAYDKVFSYMNTNAVTVPLFYPNDIFVHRADTRGFTWGPIIDDPVIWNNLERVE
ncbi:ABC transporter substrate-binding protein [Bacillus cereus]|uniref:ABC transporter substrate-binding protein n=1 Tax=Bacillus cereus TaxID=1396 RepID=UPI0027D30647|nr:ABC transporter substrate-binding protein [Bacillus cereus]